MVDNPPGQLPEVPGYKLARSANSAAKIQTFESKSYVLTSAIAIFLSVRKQQTT